MYPSTRFLTSSASLVFFFFFNDTATTEIYTLSLHDALPISRSRARRATARARPPRPGSSRRSARRGFAPSRPRGPGRFHHRAWRGPRRRLASGGRGPARRSCEPAGRRSRPAASRVGRPAPARRAGAPAPGGWSAPRSPPRRWPPPRAPGPDRDAAGASRPSRDSTDTGPDGSPPRWGSRAESSDGGSARPGQQPLLEVPHLPGRGLRRVEHAVEVDEEDRRIARAALGLGEALVE